KLRRLEQIEILRAKSRIKFAQGLWRLSSSQADAGCLVGLARHCVFHELRSRRTHKNSPVMQNLRVARTHFRSDDPDVLRKVDLHENVLVVDRPGRRHIEVLGHLNDHVRFDIPSLMKNYRRRLILWIAFERAAVGPGTESLDVRVGQPFIVGEMTVLRIREPRRHLALNYSSLNRLCPRTDFLKRKERHRSDLSGPMACLAVLLQNRENVFIERDGSRLQLFLRVHRCSHRHQYKQHTHKLELSQSHNTLPDDLTFIVECIFEGKDFEPSLRLPAMSRLHTCIEWITRRRTSAPNFFLGIDVRRISSLEDELQLISDNPSASI